MRDSLESIRDLRHDIRNHFCLATLWADLPGKTGDVQWVTCRGDRNLPKVNLNPARPEEVRV